MSLFFCKYWALLPSGGETEICYSSTIKYRAGGFIMLLFNSMLLFVRSTRAALHDSHFKLCIVEPPVIPVRLGYIFQFPFLELAAPQKRVWTAGGWASCAQSIFMIPTISDIIQRQDLKTVWSEPWEQFEALGTPGRHVCLPISLFQTLPMFKMSIHECNSVYTHEILY